jgi:hypothetical protein
MCMGAVKLFYTFSTDSKMEPRQANFYLEDSAREYFEGLQDLVKDVAEAFAAQAGGPSSKDAMLIRCEFSAPAASLEDCELCLSIPSFHLLTLILLNLACHQRASKSTLARSSRSLECCMLESTCSRLPCQETALHRRGCPSRLFTFRSASWPRRHSTRAGSFLPGLCTFCPSHSAESW